MTPRQDTQATAAKHKPTAIEVSPHIVQEFKVAGVAQVIVVLKAPVAAGASLSATDVQPDLARCFISSPLSRDAAILKAMMPAARQTALAGAAALVEAGPALPPPFRVYEHLGIILGTVSPDGLKQLQSDGRVGSVTGAPELSLIHPQTVATAEVTAGPTWGLSTLEIPRLWAEGLTGSGVIVAHLDTGADGRHPALKKAIANFAQFDDLGNEVTPSPDAFDSGEHGTHTAATVVGRSTNGIAMGVAPEARVACAMVIEGGNVIARVLSGLNWALAQGARVLSMSLGLRGWHEDWVPVIQVLRARGVLPVIAVGNEGPGTSRSPGNYAEALSVGAIDQSGVVAGFSSSQTFTRTVDPIVPDVVAPGVNVVSAVPGGGFKSMSGTSMATPHVAGLAALLFNAKPGARVDEVEDAIFKSSVLNPGMSPDRAGRGVPNAVRALEVLTGTRLPSPTIASVSQAKVSGKKERISGHSSSKTKSSKHSSESSKQSSKKKSFKKKRSR